MRLNDNGDLLHGSHSDTTLYNNTSGGGINLMASNRLDVARAGDVVATFNRMTDNGQVIQIYGQGGHTGSIGASGGAAYYGGNTHGLMMNGQNVEPCNIGGTRVGNAVDIGSANYLMRNGYFQTGIYMGGGVGAANHFSDYEEGTWAPYFSTDGGAQPSGQTYSIRSGHYVKIGNWVMYTFDVGMGTFSSASSTPNSGTYVTLGGFPFSGKSGASNATGALVAGYYSGFSISHPLGGYLNGTTQYLMEQGGSGTDYINVSENKVASNARIIGYVLQLTNS